LNEKDTYTHDPLFFAWSVTALSAQSADEIVKKMIDAQGGKKVYESIKDMTIKGTMEIIPQGMEADVTVYKKEPNQRRSDIEIMGMVITSAYDGKMAWGTNQQTMEIEEFLGDQAANLKREAMPVIAPLYPEKYGLKHALKGKEAIEGKEYWVLERTYSDDYTATIYLDTQTYLPYKSFVKVVGADGMEHDVESIQTDYKTVNGLVMAHSTKQIVDGMDYLLILVSEVTFNTGLDDSLFVMEK
jgi:outer membrane lipoprotein-sorting protein